MFLYIFMKKIGVNLLFIIMNKFEKCWNVDMIASESQADYINKRKLKPRFSQLLHLCCVLLSWAVFFWKWMWSSKIRTEKPKWKPNLCLLKYSLNLTTYLLGTHQGCVYINTAVCSKLLIKTNNGCRFIYLFPLPTRFFKHNLVYITNW